ncbi:MAG: hypothetical protein GEV11_12075 [Streptosporangiales bacterium]|nr:hypothetical protein [Streptosporangiales bacterium]
MLDHSGWVDPTTDTQPIPVIRATVSKPEAPAEPYAAPGRTSRWAGRAPAGAAPPPQRPAVPEWESQALVPVPIRGVAAPARVPALALTFVLSLCGLTASVLAAEDPVASAAGAPVTVPGEAPDTTAQRLLPAKVRYVDRYRVRSTAHRVGVAPPADCADAVDKASAARLARAGCRRIHRATYVDASGALLMTVGIAEFTRHVPPVTGAPPKVRAVAFPRTVADRFTDRARIRTEAHVAGPHLVMVATGYADGRPAAGLPAALRENTDMVAAGSGVGQAILDRVNRCAAGDDPC